MGVYSFAFKGGRAISLTAILLFGCTNSFGWSHGPKVRLCDEKEFPSATSVYISIKDEEGEEVYNQVCSGVIAKDPQLFLGTAHCLVTADRLTGGFELLPPSIRERYIKRNKQDGEKAKPVLHVEYFVDGIKAKMAVSSGDDRPMVLVLEKPSSRPSAKLELDHPFQAGTICHVVGSSPVPDLSSLPGKTPSSESSFIEWSDYVARRSSLFRKPKRRCAETPYSGEELQKNRDLYFFEGDGKETDAMESGDSGAPCFVKNKHQEWVVAGFHEASIPKYLKRGILHGNGQFLFNGPFGSQVETVLGDALRLKDLDPAKPHAEKKLRSTDGFHFSQQ